MIGGSPSRINDRTLADLDNAVTGTEPNSGRGLDKIDVRPLILMVVDIIGDLTKQDALGTKHPECFSRKGRIEMREVIAVLFRRAEPEPEARVKVLLLVPPLIRDVWRVVYDYIKGCVFERHRSIVGDNGRAVAPRYVQPNNFTFAAAPEPTPFTVASRIRFGLL